MNINDNFVEIKELNTEELLTTEGGRFAYDVGFILREGWIYVSNGGGIHGQLAVSVDLSLNYHPKN